jgi:hypothetical protein
VEADVANLMVMMEEIAEALEAEAPWRVERIGSTLVITMSAPMAGHWNTLLDEIQAHLRPPPRAIYLPSRIERASAGDAHMLEQLWETLGSFGISNLHASDAEGASRHRDQTGDDPVVEAPASRGLIAYRYLLMTSDGRSLEVEADFYQHEHDD